MSGVRVHIRPAVLVVLALLAPASPAVAQENFEIQVYGAATAAPGQTMVELHSNVAARGTTRKEDGVLPTQGALQQHQIFPVVDIDLGPRWELNADGGVGLTPSTDGRIFKVILGYRFGGEVQEKK